MVGQTTNFTYLFENVVLSLLGENNRSSVATRLGVGVSGVRIRITVNVCIRPYQIDFMFHGQTTPKF